SRTAGASSCRAGRTEFSSCKCTQRGIAATKKDDAKMAFFPQASWCLIPPAWGECHEDSMALPRQVRKPHRLHLALLRPRHLQGSSCLGGSVPTREVRRPRSESAPQRLHEDHGTSVFRPFGGPCSDLGPKGQSHL